jgi:uncharacterized protein GlcG (DUF336 family)
MSLGCDQDDRGGVAIKGNGALLRHRLHEQAHEEGTTMRKILFGALVAILATAMSVAWFTQSGSADKGDNSGRGNQNTTKAVQVLTLDAAQKLADTAERECAKQGFAVTVVVVDRDGITLVTLRNEDATGATVAVALGKASASAGFQSPSGALQEAAKTNPGLISLPGFVILPGGEPIAVGGRVVGGVGVSGAPSGDIDDSCAKVGLATLS